jgi:uncharacterized protein YecE (DUF72 family)
MQLYTGTSGFSYKEWKGPFYPEKLPQAKFLEYYAGQLTTVEINNTFYRMPRPEMLAGWREKVPENFRFVIKASQRITHRARLKECAESVAYLWQACQELGANLGPLLFQLPPYFRADVEVLKTFLGELPDGLRGAFEFRHASWFEDAVVDALRDAGQVLCAADTDAAKPPRLEVTADWGYLRLRREDYVSDDLKTWHERIQGLPWRETFVFFKHEDAGKGPLLAREFAERFASTD